MIIKTLWKQRGKRINFVLLLLNIYPSFSTLMNQTPIVFELILLMLHCVCNLLQQKQRKKKKLLLQPPTTEQQQPFPYANIKTDY